MNVTSTENHGRTTATMSTTETSVVTTSTSLDSDDADDSDKLSATTDDMIFQRVRLTIDAPLSEWNWRQFRDELADFLGVGAVSLTQFAAAQESEESAGEMIAFVELSLSAIESQTTPDRISRRWTALVNEKALNVQRVEFLASDFKPSEGDDDDYTIYIIVGGVVVGVLFFFGICGVFLMSKKRSKNADMKLASTDSPPTSSTSTGKSGAPEAEHYSSFRDEYTRIDIPQKDANQYGKGFDSNQNSGDNQQHYLNVDEIGI